ncbi:MAG: hypothetical protein GEV13_17755 [Rhodospirillales bacterium]|nr:hypothetical protein [Rhodospirillales bacterium]
MAELCLRSLLAALPREDLEQMGQASLRILECYRVLQKSETNVVAELLRDCGSFRQWEHLPEDDVIDYGSDSQYFYHAHTPEDRSTDWSYEHGHFHTFLRRTGIPEDATPVVVPGDDLPESTSQTNCHLITVSMNAAGYPARLFTVNRWVTGDTWYAADDVRRFVSRFEIDQVQPSWPVNIWITEMLRLFRPQIAQLLLDRDAAIASWGKAHPGKNPHEARDIEILSWTDISVEQQVAALDAELKARGQAGFIV